MQLSLRLLVPPGSVLLSAPDIAPFLGPLDEEALSYRWTHPDPRMDRLEAEVAALVEAADAGRRAAGGHLPPHPSAGRRRPRASPDEAPAPSRIGLRPRREPPHLTESWFCCAQPTRRQLDAF